VVYLRLDEIIKIVNEIEDEMTSVPKHELQSDQKYIAWTKLVINKLRSKIILYAKQKNKL
tara:strand:+ start:8131 stop:8310 length:180 start_codon:yes stop_codon:yes gene_type:complete